MLSDADKYSFGESAKNTWFKLIASLKRYCQFLIYIFKNPILKYKIYINKIFSESGAGLFLSI